MHGNFQQCSVLLMRYQRGWWNMTLVCGLLASEARAVPLTTMADLAVA